MQITMSRDYFTAFVNQQPQALTVTPPYPVDSPQLLRLINGSVNLYAVGFSLHLADYREQDLPSLWQWPLSYDDNVIRGDRPDQKMLVVSRISSALFLAASAAVLFGIGWQLKGRWAGYISSGLYALNPVILLNGRRAMMEGSVLCFGLLAILLAILICRGRNGWRWWFALGIISGLTLASKHSGLVYVAAAFAWVIVREIQDFLPQRHREISAEPPPHPSPASDGGSNTIGGSVIRGGLSVVVMVMVFIALSPAQWNNPIARLNDLIGQRAELLASQVKAEPDAPTPISERINGIITQPYIQAPVYFEVGFWAGAAPIQAEIAQYDPSIWSGFHAGTVIGAMLTLLAALGILVSVREWRTWKIGLLLWLAVVIASLLVNPLPWQRYYLALYPLMNMLTAIGSLAVIKKFQGRLSA